MGVAVVEEDAVVVAINLPMVEVEGIWEVVVAVEVMAGVVVVEDTVVEVVVVAEVDIDANSHF